MERGGTENEGGGRERKGIDEGQKERRERKKMRWWRENRERGVIMKIVWSE